MTAELAVGDTRLRALQEFGTSTVYEASGVDCWLAPRIRPSWPGAKTVGPAFTAQVANGDNLAVHHAVRQAPPGSVLVVAAGQGEYGHCGEILATIAATRGVAGAVIDGSMRDVVEIQALGFPVFSTGVCMRTAVKKNPGTVGQPVRVGDRDVRPGDIILADADGVLALPPSLVDQTLERAQQRFEREQATLAKIRAGDIPPVPVGKAGAKERDNAQHGDRPAASR